MSELVRDESAWADISNTMAWGRVYDTQRDEGTKQLVLQGGGERVSEAIWSGWTPSARDPRGVGHDMKSAVAMLLRILKERCAT